MKRYTTLLFLLLIGTSGNTCPICNSATGKQVRASLLGADLNYNLAVTIAPFAIFALITFLIYKGTYPFSKKNKQAV